MLHGFLLALVQNDLAINSMYASIVVETNSYSIRHFESDLVKPISWTCSPVAPQVLRLSFMCKMIFVPLRKERERLSFYAVLVDLSASCDGRRPQNRTSILKTNVFSGLGYWKAPLLPIETAPNKLFERARSHILRHSFCLAAETVNEGFDTKCPYNNLG